jgi:hypothetical protein
LLWAYSQCHNHDFPIEQYADRFVTRLYKARDFEGVGGPEDKERIYAEEQGGNDDVRGNIRQQGEDARR